jgi:hypothetical protein
MKFPIILSRTIFTVIALFFFNTIQSQGKITGTVKGLAYKDTAIVSIQKSAEQYYFKKIGGNASNGDVLFDFSGISNGKWAISIDVKGYLFPMAKQVEVNNNTINNIITLTKAPADSNFSYQWQDDSSYVGHAQQAYINDKVQINVFGLAETLPTDFNAINIFYQYGFLLSDEGSKWTSEDAYRLYQTLKKLNFQKFGEGQEAMLKAKWILSDTNIDKDLTFTKKEGVDIVTISRNAFTYAAPQVVTVDGVKGKFFSKRLFSAVVYYFTDKGTNQGLIDEIAKTRYGFEFMVPSPKLKTLMNETETNFQPFTSEEKIIILSMFEEFPDPMQRQDQLKYLVRRVNGQKHPIYPLAPAIAWTTNQNIEWMESAFKDQSIEYMQRLVLHEKAHFLWAHTFDASTKDDWSTTGGWFKDPISGSGWSTTNTTAFVSAYAHLKNPDEDMAESIAFYITNPEALRSRALLKFEFIRDRIMKGTRYISVIRPDLTFQVYNLYPDYNYPGKIKRTKLEVFGKENEDKKIIFEIELTIMNKAFDGAQNAQCRFVSPNGTIKDMWLNKVNAEGSILRGEITLSKFAKSGYWIIPQVTVWDAVGNQRLENNSTYGVKCFVNNPLEDVTAPLYVQGSLKMDSTVGKFSQFAGETDPNGALMQAMRIRFNFVEKNTINPNGRVWARIFLPSIDSTDKYNIVPYSKDVQRNGTGIINDFPDSLKKCDFFFPVPDYFPSGYYSISYMEMQDVALNVRGVFLDKDTANKNFFMAPKYINQRALRDSVYFKTKYPDYKPPVLDLNDIKIQATPTNPTSPNGETLFEMSIWVKDESDFPGHASGFSDGYYTLRDPQGLEHSYNIFDVNYFYSLIPDSSIHGYKLYRAKTLLPVGSPPGLWGVSSITLFDKARNKKYYNFVEIVRFDVEQSKTMQVNPYVEIVGKKVNAAVVDSVQVYIGCKSCKDQNYRLRMYSSMGGSSVVYEGKMTADTIQLKNLKLSGINDGILYATVFMLDSSKALIGTGKAVYTKDTKVPTSQKLQTNLANFGKSNLDSLIIQIESSERNGEFKLVAVQSTVVSNVAAPNAMGDLEKSSLKNTQQFAVGDSILISGNYTNGNFNINSAILKSMQDGMIEIKFYLIDSVGNVGLPVKKILYKDTKDPVPTIKKISQTGLSAVMSVTLNEFVSTSLAISNINITKATISSIEKIDSKNFKVNLTRICSDSLKMEIKAGTFSDTVGNLNQLTVFQAVDSLLPVRPTVSAVSACLGSTPTALSVTATAGNALRWYGTNAAGGVADSIAPIPSTSAVGSTDYYVVHRNVITGCEGPRSKINVTINPIPPTPTITKDTANFLVSTVAKGNIWFKDGILQPDTTQKVKPTQNGLYTVKASQLGCTGLASESYYYLASSLGNMLGLGERLRFSPNPFISDIGVFFNIIGHRSIAIKVYDMRGVLIKNLTNLSNGAQLGLGGIPSGMYTFVTYNSKGQIIHIDRLVKNK